MRPSTLYGRVAGMMSQDHQLDRRYTLAAAGKLLGVSRERVRQLAAELEVGDPRYASRLSEDDFAAIKARLAAPRAPGRPKQTPSGID